MDIFGHCSRKKQLPRSNPARVKRTTWTCLKMCASTNMFKRRISKSFPQHIKKKPSIIWSLWGTSGKGVRWRPGALHMAEKRGRFSSHSPLWNFPLHWDVDVLKHVEWGKSMRIKGKTTLLIRTPGNKLIHAEIIHNSLHIPLSTTILRNHLILHPNISKRVLNPKNPSINHEFPFGRHKIPMFDG
jgi:hypothetical protein